MFIFIHSASFALFIHYCNPVNDIIDCASEATILDHSFDLKIVCASLTASFSGRVNAANTWHDVSKNVLFIFNIIAHILLYSDAFHLMSLFVSKAETLFLLHLNSTNFTQLFRCL